MLRGLKQTFCTPGPKDPTETGTEVGLSVSCRGTGQQWAAAGAGPQGAVDLGRAGCIRLAYGLSSLGGGRHQPHHIAVRTYTGMGK